MCPTSQPLSPDRVVRVRLLGTVQVTVDEAQGVVLASQRMLWALVALLISPEAVPRQRLAGWLWGDRDDRVARTNLRVAIHGLRQALGDRIAGDRQRLWWLPGAHDTVDLHQLRARLREGGAALDGPPLLPGPLCAGLVSAATEAEGAEAFVDWLAGQRARLTKAVVQAHLSRASALTDAGARLGAEQQVRLALALAPENTAAHSLLLRILSATGQRAALDLHRQVLQATETPHRLVRQAREVLGRVPPPRLGHVPAMADRFVGRAAEQAQLRSLLAAGRLVTIAGLGGMGKTRLALWLAQDWRARDGVWFVDLAGTGPGEIATAVVHVLGLLPALHQPAAETLAAALSDRDLLLVFDNAEVAEDDVAALATLLLARAPLLRLLVTSRRPLRLRAEQVLSLQGLSLSAPEQALGDAGALFLARDPGALRDPGLADLLAALEGMPLAIELAAALRRRLGSSGAVLRQLRAAGLAPLHAEERDRPDRHRSLEAALSGTWALLTPAARTLLVALSTFLGPFTASRVAATPEEQAALEALCEAAALTRLPGGRLRLHPAARDFAAARQADPEALRCWHRDQVLAEVATTRMQSYTDRHATAMDTLRVLRDDLFAAWDRAFVAGDGEGLATLLPLLWDAAEAQGWFQEAEARFRLALAHEASDTAPIRWAWAWMLGRLGRVEEGLEAIEGLPLARLEEQRTRAVLCVHAGRLDEARQIADRILAASEDGDVQVWNLSGIIALRQGDPARAQHCFQTGNDAARAQGLAMRLPTLLHGLASVARFQGALAEARRLHQEALALRRVASDPRGLALTLTSLAACEAEQGDLEASRSHLLEARRLAWDVGDPPGRALAEHNLGCLELLADPLEAEGRLSAAVVLRRQQRDGVGLAYSLAARAEARARCGQPDAARADLREAQALAAHYPDVRLTRQLARHAAHVPDGGSPAAV